MGGIAGRGQGRDDEVTTVREFTDDPDVAGLTVNRHPIDARQRLQNLRHMQTR